MEPAELPPGLFLELLIPPKPAQRNLPWPTKTAGVLEPHSTPPGRTGDHSVQLETMCEKCRVFGGNGQSLQNLGLGWLWPLLCQEKTTGAEVQSRSLCFAMLGWQRGNKQT